VKISNLELIQWTVRTCAVWGTREPVFGIDSVTRRKKHVPEDFMCNEF